MNQNKLEVAPKTGDIMNPVFMAMSYLRRRKYDQCIDICTQHLLKHPNDLAVRFLKLRALTLQVYIDDTEMEEEGIAEILMDDNNMSKTPRPGTSLNRPLTSTNGPGHQHIRPMSSSGRPLSGYARPGSSHQSRGGTGRTTTATGAALEKAFQGTRPGTSRPVSVQGRYVRLGTASLITGQNESFVEVTKINAKKQVKRPAYAKGLLDYLVYVEHNYKVALELANEFKDSKDWWWQARLGKCYYHLGMLREAETQFKKSINLQEMIVSILELCKVYIRVDQPNQCLDRYVEASKKFVGDPSLLLGAARIYDMLNNVEKGVEFYKKVLQYNSSNCEAMACLASHHFYTDQPEIALRFYRRLLQMGVNNTELWNNLALCCFYASQYDMALNCFKRALHMATDDNMADVWYNIGQMAVGIGDLNLAYQAFKIAVSVDGNHAESYNNLGILELRKGNIDKARTNFESAYKKMPHMYEPFFNASLVAFKIGNCQESHDMAHKALAAFPDHADSKELLKQLNKHFTML